VSDFSGSVVDIVYAMLNYQPAQGDIYYLAILVSYRPLACYYW